jgi:hypothetical protein
MPRIPPLLAGCILVAAIAAATAGIWLYVRGARSLSPAAIVACTVISVVLALAVEAAVRHVRRGRPRRAHARTTPTRKDTPAA